MTVANFVALEKQLNLEVLERSEEIHTACLALIARRHHFQIGPPGTAKSLLVAQLAKKIDNLPPGGYFHYLLTQFTVPGELYGPPDLRDMKDKGIYRLNTAGKLPVAYIAFLDEIFKGNSSILNANLTIMNERKFFNSTDDPDIPLISMFAASNELPGAENLGALWDRLHFRHEVDNLQETSSFMSMLKPNRPAASDKLISLEEIIMAAGEAAEIPISKQCFDAIKDLRAAMRAEGCFATERRWMDCLPIIRAEAWMLGREVADVDCMRPLMHVLWNEPKDRTTIQKLILDIANPLDKEAGVLLDKLRQIDVQIKDVLGTNTRPEAKQVAKLGVEIHGKLDSVSRKYDELEATLKANGATSIVLPRVQHLLTEYTATLVEQIFGFEPGTELPKVK